MDPREAMDAIVGLQVKRRAVEQNAGAEVPMGAGTGAPIGTGTVGTGAAGSGGTGMASGMGALPATIGTGAHQQPLMLGVLQAIRTIGTDVQGLKMASCKFGEGPAEWKYVAMGVQIRKEYGQACSAAKGTGYRVGAVKNWLKAGFYVTYMEDSDATAEGNEAVKNLMGKYLLNADGRVDTKNFGNIAHMVTHVEVTQVRHAYYLTVSVTGEEGQKALILLEDVWGKQAQRQTDPPPPKPILKELRDVERKARDAVKGGGKGV